MNATVRQLLDTADLLVADSGEVTVIPAVPVPAQATATTTNRCRGAAFALRIALESTVAQRLTADGAPPAISAGTQRAAFLWLRGCVDVTTARRAKAVWSQLCLGCHYHQYEIGPTPDQIRVWATEVAAIVALLAP
ncbi:hypothetical protein ACIOC1_04530 [Streptomyces sp. NPDC088197]|uniref:hypothetical protein n=1 Tax=Streptomyces sp. NPDC088197 TaxID=3365840 RepID=UPI003814E898